jgi:molecular chaperone GrpE (heat shock protein)
MAATMPPYRLALQTLMTEAGIAHRQELAQRSRLSDWQLSRVEWGLLPHLSLQAAVQLAIALNCPVEELMGRLSAQGQNSDAGTTLRQDYQRLQTQLEQQQQTLEKIFRQQVVKVLEPWLLQWPSAAAAAEQNANWPAQKILPLVRPLWTLLQQWDIQITAPVGTIVAYDPQWHQPLDPEQELEPGTAAEIRYAGYRQGERLLYRAQVIPSQAQE